MTFSESLPSLDRLVEKHRVWQLFLRTTETKTNRKQAGEKGPKAESRIQRRQGTVEALCVKKIKKRERGQGDVVHRWEKNKEQGPGRLERRGGSAIRAHLKTQKPRLALFKIG